MGAEKENEMKLRAELLAKYENDERLQRLSAQKRRLKMAQHKRDVEDIIAERQRLKALALEKRRKGARANHSRRTNATHQTARAQTQAISQHQNRHESGRDGPHRQISRIVNQCFGFSYLKTVCVE